MPRNKEAPKKYSVLLDNSKR